MTGDRTELACCPFCREENERSTVYAPSRRFTTAMAGSRYYDEHGAYHDHDPNWSTSEWSCSLGHAWTESSRAKCPSCDYGGERKVAKRG